MSANAWNEERLGELLCLLRPAPTGWVEAAAHMPRLHAVLDGLVERAQVDAAFRKALVADLEAALTGEGVEPTPAAVRALELRLK
jgi:hypothetical protein